VNWTNNIKKAACGLLMTISGLSLAVTAKGQAAAAPSTTMAVNSITNKTYVINQRNNTVSVIDGATNQVTPVPTGLSPVSLALNTTTNKVYIANSLNSSLTVIDGLTNNTATVPVGPMPNALVVNAATNKIYVASSSTSDITVVDGATNTAASLTVANPVVQPVVFQGLDTTTSGNWNGKYGSGGYMIANGNSTNLDHATVSLSQDFSYTWAGLTNDTRALQISPGAAGGIASAFVNYYGDSFYINLNVYDSKPHRVALYLLDWETAGRSETIAVSDASTGQVYDTQSFSNFQDGQYAVWQMMGNLTIKVTPNSGPGAVVSGIFLN
jgi:YVTN family beta-propeller protein